MLNLSTIGALDFEGASSIVTSGKFSNEFVDLFFRCSLEDALQVINYQGNVDATY